MILFCSCISSEADSHYGKGKRSHTALTSRLGKVREYMCIYCYYVRTKAEGMRDGTKRKRKG